MKYERKNIVLRENGVPKIFPVYELETEMLNGTYEDLWGNITKGTCKWIPDDRYEIKHLEVTKNGHYTANQYNCDGFNGVTVKFELPMTGFARDGTPYEVYADSSGRLHILVKRGAEQ